MKRNTMQMALWTIAAILAGYVIIVLLAYLFQGGMMYHPSREINQTPEMMGLQYEELEFKSADGLPLSGWFIPADNPRGTLLFSHGNAGNMAGRLGTIHIMHSLNLNVMIYDYRGYGRSRGRPSEEGTYMDVMGAWNYLTEERGIAGERILLMGRSLGGPVSAWLSNRTQAAGLILESTFTSAVDLASELYPILPVRLLMKYEYPTLEYLRSASMPVLVSHSKKDGLVPYHHARTLFEAAPEPKMFLEMQGGHGGGHIETGQAYIDRLEKFLNEKARL